MIEAISTRELLPNTQPDPLNMLWREKARPRLTSPEVPPHNQHV